MTLYYDLGGFGVAAIFLFITTYWLLKSLNVISRFLRLSEFVAGFIFLAIGTSIPELIVGVTSAIKGVPSISLGNIIGANIIDLTLVIGIPVILVRGIKIRESVVKHDTYIMLGMVALPTILMFLGRTLSRIDGVILLVSFGLYVWWVLKQKDSFTKKVKNHVSRESAALNFTIFFISLFALFKSADYIVMFAEKVAIGISLPKIFIGVFIIAIGTTLPELITATRTAISGYKELTAGVTIGTVIVNSSLVLGVVSVISPIETNFAYFGFSSLFLLLFAFMFVVFVSSENKLDFKEGIALVLMYVMFLLVMLSLKGVLI